MKIEPEFSSKLTSQGSSFVPLLTPNFSSTPFSPVADGDVLQFGAMKFEVNFTPGHTVGHVIFRLDGSPFGAPDSLFSGDHLFLCGCGQSDLYHICYMDFIVISIESCE